MKKIFTKTEFVSVRNLVCDSLPVRNRIVLIVI